MNSSRKYATWIRTNKAFFPMIVVVTLVALIPLYGVLFPSVVDLAEHILVSKLLWEKLTGVSHLDLTISWFLAYRLFPILMLFIFSVVTLGRISFVYLPIIVATTLISIHAIVIVMTLYSQLQNRSWKSSALALSFVLPAVVAMYSAAWFLGLVNYTLAITLLVPCVFLTERFLRSGRWIDAFWLFVALGLTYMAHPFAPTFWLLWCLCRAIASAVTLKFFAEWKRLILLAAIFLPIFLYHFLWTASSPLAPSTGSLLAHWPFVSVRDWYRYRLHDFLYGTYLKADDATNSTLFGIFAIGLILFSTLLAFRSRAAAHLKRIALSSLLFLIVASWLNEKSFPVPSGVWLAYDNRYSSTAYVVCLTVAGLVLIRSSPLATNKSLHKIIFAVIAFVAVFASVDHLVMVRKAYLRFDEQARKYMAKVLNNEQAVGIYLPHTPWHPDGTYLNHYVCLKQTDCVSKGTTFGTGYAADLFPVKLRSYGQNAASAPAATLKAAPLFSGNKGTAEGQLNWPRGIAIDHQQRIVIADTLNGRIERFSLDGAFLDSFGHPGHGEGEFADPSGVAVDDRGDIYVADFSNHRIEKFDYDGRFIAQWNGPDTAFAPHALAFGPNNSVYVADEGGARIVKFDSRGKIIDAWGARGKGDGQFNQITSIAVDQRIRRVYVPDPRNGRLVVFDLSGKFVANWPVEGWKEIANAWYLQSVVVDSKASRVYATGMENPEVLVFDLTGSKIASLKTEPADKLSGASAMALLPDKLYVLNTFASLVAVIDLAKPLPAGSTENPPSTPQANKNSR